MNDIRKACVEAIFREFENEGDAIRPAYADGWDDIEARRSLGHIVGCIDLDVPDLAVLANAIDTRRNWVGEKADDALPRIGVSATVDSTMIRFMECRGEGHIALTVTEAGRLASWLHDMADGRWRDHNGYVPEVVK